MSKPILILSDGPSSGTGLGRITRDLAQRIHAHMPQYRVGTFGLGDVGSRELPWVQYSMTRLEGWRPLDLEYVCRDFFGDEDGIIFTIWDAARLGWMDEVPYKKWGYFPVDAELVDGRVAHEDVMRKFDRTLMYSEWAAKKIIANGWVRHYEHLPHGIDTSKFFRCPGGKRSLGQNLIGKQIDISPESLLVGIVATNQPRKNFGSALDGMALLARMAEMGQIDEDVRVWIHTDSLDRHWPLLQMVYNHRLMERTIITTGEVSDRQLANLYSDCNVTLGIGKGEGFGYPIYESLACGTPCLHVDYAGGAEWLPETMKIKPEALEVVDGYLRPVVHPEQWAKAILEQRKTPETVHFPEELDWKNLWPRWERWLTQ